MEEEGGFGRTHDGHTKKLRFHEMQVYNRLYKYLTSRSTIVLEELKATQLHKDMAAFM
jgi:hypothetical protein